MTAEIIYNHDEILRFLGNIDIQYYDSCWEWKLGKSKDGYGKVKIQGKTKVASRVSYEMFFGAIPDGMLVCHTCDNPPCCNPKHLFLGTYADNTHDKINKGRSNYLFGSKHQNTKLTEDQVREIRLLYSTGNYTQVELSKIFGTCFQNISDIISHKRWKWLD